MKNILLYTLLGLMTVCFTGCKSSKTQKEISNEYLSVTLPKNWELVYDKVNNNGTGRIVEIEDGTSKKGTFLMISVMTDKQDVDFDEFKSAIKKHYETKMSEFSKVTKLRETAVDIFDAGGYLTDYLLQAEGTENEKSRVFLIKLDDDKVVHIQGGSRIEDWEKFEKDYETILNSIEFK